MSERPDESSSAFSDEDWARFQQEAEASVRRRGGEAPKEPSARAREVTARLIALDEQAAAQRKRRGRGPRRGRRRGAGSEPWRPEGWRTGPGLHEVRSGRRWRKLAAMVGAVALVAVAFLGVGMLTGDRAWWDSADDAPPLPAETALPTGAPPTLNPDLPTLERPFAGSPARRWGDGADAIELPEAKAVGGVPAEQIADGLRLTKEFLVAANLDRDVLNGGRPEKALALIDPLEKDFLADLRHHLEDPQPGASPIGTFTRFDTDEVRLVGRVVKVRGRMTVQAGDHEGRAVIHTDYTFVYPVTRASGSGEVTRTIVRRGFDVMVAAADGNVRSTPGTLWVVRHDVFHANGGCVTKDGLLHPSFPSDRAGDPHADGPTADPYDRSGPLISGTPEGECGTYTRI